MARSICLLLLISISSFGQRTTSDFYGTMKTEDGVRRFYLKFSNRQPYLMVITSRRYPISVTRVKSTSDSIRFRRKDSAEEYKGKMTSGSGIDGIWIDDSGKRLALNFVPADPDTISGLHPRKEKSYVYSIPEFDLADGIHVSDKQAARMSSKLLDNLNREIIKGKYDYVHALLVARENKLVVEEYFYGFPPAGHFGIQSVTKSFVSALVGIALENGEIQELTTPLCKYLSPYRPLSCNSPNGNIQLRHLLSMSTGLRWDEVTYPYGHEKNTSMIAEESGDAIKYLLTQPRSSSLVFAYNSLNHTIINHVLKEATGLTNEVELKTRLLDPLGITVYDTGESNNGILGDIFLRPRDMLKFGLTYLNNGRWNDRQIVPAWWVKESTSTKITVRPNLGYGYFWWTKKFDWNGGKVDAYFAWGYGGQYIFVVPELELTAVLMGTNWSTEPEGKYTAIFQKIITACQ